MRKIVGYLSCLTVLLIAIPAIWVSAQRLEHTFHESVNPQPDRPGPEYIGRMSRIDLKDDMAANLPEVEVPAVNPGEVTNWPAPERVDVVLERILAPSQTVYMTSHWTRDGNYNIKDYFIPGQTVYWVVGIQNDSGGNASVTAVWDIEDPYGGSVFYSNPTWTVPAGYSAWQYNGVVSSVGGWYTFYASVDHAGHLTQGTRYYKVNPYVCYLPIVQR